MSPIGCFQCRDGPASRPGPGPRKPTVALLPATTVRFERAAGAMSRDLNHRNTGQISTHKALEQTIFCETSVTASVASLSHGESRTRYYRRTPGYNLTGVTGPTDDRPGCAHSGTREDAGTSDSPSRWLWRQSDTVAQGHS
eukprot:22604-Hanusia_phi.AAC.1